MLLEGDAWQGYFDSFKRSAFRLETHPVYTMPGERDTYQRYLSGEEPTGDHAAQWVEKVRHYRETGRTIGRVHVVTCPLSEYLRYEFEWWYRFNAAAGEDIRILDLTDKANPGVPDYDFWLFDDLHIVRMMYRPDGTQIGRELLENVDPGDYIRYRDIAVSSSVPFVEYVAD
ncbi:DUF6879 family protein [Nonomuraea sp. NPDC050404]|uniref:DUF6879 family protein n=1 Tax=Nonomuraea sp. NPDC050404 TaxID=3155783 RepID=UPI0034105587